MRISIPRVKSSRRSRAVGFFQSSSSPLKKFIQAVSTVLTCNLRSWTTKPDWDLTNWGGTGEAGIESWNRCNLPASRQRFYQDRTRLDHRHTLFQPLSVILAYPRLIRYSCHEKKKRKRESQTGQCSCPPRPSSRVVPVASVKPVAKRRSLPAAAPTAQASKAADSSKIQLPQGRKNTTRLSRS